MGVARFLAKSWIVLCLFAGGHGLAQSIGAGTLPLEALLHTAPVVILFTAMGLLFVGGYGASAHNFFATLKVDHVMPHFTDIVFALFAALSLLDQIAIAPHYATGSLSDAIETPLNLIPGQRAFIRALAPCSLDGGRIFASAIAWLLAFVLFGSSLSRLRLASGLLRLERNRRVPPLSAGVAALLLGVTSIVGIQLLLIGSLYAFVPCSTFATITGEVLIGLGPLLLAYMVITALTALMATGAET
jgi:hypothetical protein